MAIPNRQYYPFDKIIIGYCLLMIFLIAIFGRPLKEYADELFIYAICLTLAAVIPLFFDETRGRISAFTRILYAGILFGVFYRTTGGLMFLIFDKFFDFQLVAFEKLIFGIEPTTYIDKNLLSPILNEIFSFCYFCYYLMVPGFLIVTFVKKDYEILKRYLAAAGLTYFVSFLLFIFYPIEGPRWYEAGKYLYTIDGYLFRYLVEIIIAKGAVHGGCMPSSHIAIAIVIMMYCFKHYRKWGWILLPINIGLAIGTFWGRFHYVSDVIVGVIIGFAVYAIVQKYYDRWTDHKYNQLNEKELKANLVS